MLTKRLGRQVPEPFLTAVWASAPFFYQVRAAADGHAGGSSLDVVGLGVAAIEKQWAEMKKCGEVR